MIFIKIGLIDSGLGAIFTLNHLINQNKYNEYILYLDYKNNPFGILDEKHLYEILINAINFLKNKKCEKIIIACNTLSIVALKYDVKDVIIPINFFKNEIRNNNESLLLATKYTIDSNIYNCKNNLITSLSSYIEGNNNVGINNYLDLINKYNIILLGCTHYTYLIKKLHNKIIIDSSKLLANNIMFANNKLKIDIYISKYNRNIINHINYHMHINKYSIKIIK